MLLLSLAIALAGTHAEERVVTGPGRVCIKYSMFDVAAEERFTLTHADPENASFSVAGRHGSYVLMESEVRGEQELGKLVLERPDARVYRYGRGRKVHYAVFGRPDFSPDKDKALVFLHGPALRGDARDRSIYARVHIATPDRRSCVHSYWYEQ